MVARALVVLLFVSGSSLARAESPEVVAEAPPIVMAEPPATIMREARPVRGSDALIAITADDPVLSAEARELDRLETTGDVIEIAGYSVMIPLFVTGAVLALTTDHSAVRDVGLISMGGAALFGGIGALLGAAIRPSDSAYQRLEARYNATHPDARIDYLPD